MSASWAMGWDIGKGPDKSVLAFVKDLRLVGLVDFDPKAPVQSDEGLRTVHVDLDAPITWEEFRQAMEEYTGMRFAEKVDFEIVEEAAHLRKGTP
jgi:hypothetical protein